MTGRVERVASAASPAHLYLARLDVLLQIANHLETRPTA